MSNPIHRLLRSMSSRCGKSLFRLNSLRQNISVKNIGMDRPPTTVAIIIIGNEIVKGQVQDVNSFHMCQRFHKCGVEVKSVLAIPDDLDMIAECVSNFSDKYSYVVTAGGIGPTHDDITYEAIARAFSDDLKIDEELESLYKGYFKDKYTDVHRKLSTIPTAASLFKGSGTFPVVKMKNVFILPGVPRFLKTAFQTVEGHIGSLSTVNAVRTLYLATDEMSIASLLSHVVAQFPDVTIGSYPEWSSNYYKVQIVFESPDVSQIDECKAKLEQQLPPDSVVNFNPDPLSNPKEGLEKICTGDLKEPLSQALSICEESLERFKLNEISICFNGGKDCTALLHIWYAVASQHPDYDESQGLKAIYIHNTDTFPEEELFIEQCISRYKLKLLRYHGRIKEQLAIMNKQNPDIKAVIMGTRSTDPHGNGLSPFQMTDKGWVPLMRVNPILSFSYGNVWKFLRGLSLPYCKLYDVGYTSLGSVQTTHLNPALKYVGDDGVEHYKPAYTLTDPQLERSGRHS